MRLVFAAISALFLCPSIGLAQSAPRQWDTSFTAGLFGGQPATSQQLDYGDDWFHTGDFRASVGRLWTGHLKTELEFGTTGEGSRYVTQFAPGGIAYSAREFYRLHQGTARLTWQFLDNSWVQPYVSAGVLVEAEQKRTLVFQRNATYDTPSVTTFRPGATVGAGAKFYMTPQAFFKAGASAFAKASAGQASPSISFFAGFGFDF